MSEKNSVVRSMHDIGLAAWFGGSLMGAVGLNGAAAKANDPKERLSLSAEGWKRWAPVNAVAIGAHAIGGAGLINANRRRLDQQPGAASNTAVKLGLTVVAAGLTAYAGYLGKQVDEQAHEGGAGATEPAPGASDKLAAAQKQLRMVQWAIPATTGVLIVLAAIQGEQQRPQSLVRHQVSRLTS